MIVGDKVLCINNKSIKNKNSTSNTYKYPYNITENKQYTVIDINKHYIRIVNDKDIEWFYPIENFITLEDHRNNMIENILYQSLF